MRILKSLAVAACGLMAVAFLATATPAQAQEPHYLDALSVLRTARDYIQFDHRPGFQGQRDIAVNEINKAISEIKHAAWDDGKNTRFAPPAAGVTDPWAPERHANEDLGTAQRILESGFDLPQNQGVRERAIEHVKTARHVVGEIMKGH